jgi:hypothetical protein
LGWGQAAHRKPGVDISAPLAPTPALPRKRRREKFLPPQDEKIFAYAYVFMKN